MMAIPAIAGASFIKLFDLSSGTSEVQWSNIVVGIMTSGIAAFACITIFLQLIDRIGFLPFVVYRLFLGGLLLLAM